MGGAVVVLKSEPFPIHTDEDVVRARQATRQWALDQGFSLVDQTKIVTAASELARNTVIHGGGGIMRLEALNDGPRRGLRMVFEDQGAGIPDVDMALRDGYTTGTGLGLGLGGARRLMSEFQIASVPGQGTTIIAVRWR
jgi:serine/threonine-protein kinase RsbT